MVDAHTASFDAGGKDPIGEYFEDVAKLRRDILLLEERIDALCAFLVVDDPVHQERAETRLLK